jgi:DNA-directed RNA polymerase specialized sigma subunit
MTAKEFLRQYINAEKMIDAKLDRIRRYREMATKTTTTLNPNKVQSTQENKMERIIAEICDMTAEIETSIKLLHETQNTVSEVIRQVSDPMQRIVLYRRYINGEHFEEIAVNMNYCYMQICRIHGKALESINDVIKCYIQS